MSKEQILEAIKGMSVLELNDLVKAIEEEFGVTAAAPVAVMAGGAGDAGARCGDDRGSGADAFQRQADGSRQLDGQADDGIVLYRHIVHLFSMAARACHPMGRHSVLLRHDFHVSRSRHPCEPKERSINGGEPMPRETKRQRKTVTN